MVRMRGFLGVLSLFGVLAGVHVEGHAAPQVCNVALQVCPKTLEGATINVPEDAIWLDPKLPLCTEQVQVQTGNASPPPSIVFVIDNSGSMNDTDPNEQRFKVTIELLDSIAKAQPATKVGLVIFNRRLIFDHRENAYFKQAFPGNTVEHDSYVPLTALNANVGGRTGLDTLKALLAHDNTGELVNVTRLPAVRQSSNGGWAPSNTRDGTDITLGFEAAKQAFVGDANAKENQYIVFLSDGEPTGVDTERQARIMEWRAGTNVPTTFTVFFTGSTTPPANLSTMNANIQNNGYSANNNKSTLWAYNPRNSSDLLPLLLTGVLNPIFANKPAQAANASLVSGATNISTTTIDGTNFVFPSRVPLAAGQTSVALTYNYTYTDSGKVKTHTATYNVNIRRVPNATPPTGVTTVCKESGTIELLHNNTKVNLVTADHEKLDVKLILPSGEVCTNCKVSVQPKPPATLPRATKDNEGVTVAPSGGTTFTGPFERELLATGTTAPTAGNGKLQHLPTDSIYVEWVNPLNPLDVIRKAFPYSDVRTTLDVVNHNTYSKADNSVPLVGRKQWVLVGSNSVKVNITDGVKDCCKLVQNISAVDSPKYVGIKVTASRSFKVDIKVYDNLGQYVNKIGFNVSQPEFANLPKEGTGANNPNRSLRVLWDSRTEDGSFAGTGAYIFKTTVTLNRIAGIAEDEVERTDHRRVGVVRDR